MNKRKWTAVGAASALGLGIVSVLMLIRWFWRERLGLTARPA